ncbi:hypothetical protein N7466_003367 [Penicillium verhagenii]|uniref:uncharacterized protein n=1 Tax=Penicillium verhagenii TaxID=1562060 RepID=UPI002545BC64|nr:uncharacterized protein N7466_003367 [Penicillium verhagenii]KAJ5936917.1 hypothetical protein N7466_003367 [Penicillium verhagenii]
MAPLPSPPVPPLVHRNSAKNPLVIGDDAAESGSAPSSDDGYIPPPIRTTQAPLLITDRAIIEVESGDEIEELPAVPRPRPRPTISRAEIKKVV